MYIVYTLPPVFHFCLHGVKWWTEQAVFLIDNVGTISWSFLSTTDAKRVKKKTQQRMNEYARIIVQYYYVA